MTVLQQLMCSTLFCRQADQLRLAGRSSRTSLSAVGRRGSPLHVGDEALATVRIRTTVLRARLGASQFRSQEQLIRAASISRTAWQTLLDEETQRVDLRVLAGVLKALDLSISDVLVFDADEKPIEQEPGNEVYSNSCSI